MCLAFMCVVVVKGAAGMFLFLKNNCVASMFEVCFMKMACICCGVNNIYCKVAFCRCVAGSGVSVLVAVACVALSGVSGLMGLLSYDVVCPFIIMGQPLFFSVCRMCGFLWMLLSGGM